jgi:phage replication O-like protein O
VASPQCENGFTKIANELLDAILLHRIPGQELRVVLAIMRKTYGYSKKEDQISFGQLSQLTGIPRPRVIEHFQSLVSKKILGSLNGGTRKPRFMWINKDFEQWIASPKKETSPNIETMPSLIEGNRSSLNHETHKRKKERRKKGDVVISLPEWLDPKLWEDFKTMRKKIKKPMTPKAEELAISKLSRFRAKGLNVTSIIEKSILNDWQDIFEPKISATEESMVSRDHRTVCRICKLSKSSLIDGVCTNCRSD